MSVGVKDWDESALLVEVLRRDPELGVLRSSSVSHCKIKGGSVKDFRKAFWQSICEVFKIFCTNRSETNFFIKIQTNFKKPHRFRRSGITGKSHSFTDSSCFFNGSKSKMPFFSFIICSPAAVGFWSLLSVSCPRPSWRCLGLLW